MGSMGKRQAPSMESSADVPAVPLPRLAVAYARDQGANQHNRSQRDRTSRLYAARQAPGNPALAVRVAVGASQCREARSRSDAGRAGINGTRCERHGD